MDWTTIIVSCIPAIVASTISYLTARHQSKTELKKAAQENNAAIQQLMKQHEIDIESLREQHKMEMEAKEKDHQYKLEIIQKEHENELIRKQHELENTAKYNAAGSIVTGLFNGVLGGAFNSPEVQVELTKKILEGVKSVPEDNLP